MKRTGFDTMSIYKYPLYIIRHPQDGFQEMKVNKKGSLKVATIIVLVWMFVELLYRSITDYDVNPFYNEDISLLKIALVTVLMYVMVCVSNWCFCSLLEGKGKMKDILVVAAYSLLPYIVIRSGWVLLSGLFTAEELILVNYCVVLSKLWCFIVFFVGLREMHEYTVAKTLFSICLTILGLLIMLFLGMMFLMLFQQLQSFIQTIIFEFKY